MGDVISHKCPNCGSALNYSAQDQAIKCVSCSSVFTEEEMQRYTKVLEEYDASETAAASNDTELAWDTSAGVEMDMSGQKSYRCESCGGSIIVDENAAATKCPYCDNPAIFPAQLSGVLKPDVIIPFAIQKSEMASRLKKFLSGKFLVPKIFRDNHRIEQSSGVYVPFWLYDAKVQANIVYHAEIVNSYRSGDYQVTETRHYRCYRGGNVDFENVPADASETMKDEYMDSIEPFDFSGLKQFDGMYMAGFVADKYTVSSEDCLPRVNNRIERTCEDEFAKTLRGYSSYRSVSTSIRNRENGIVKYAMIPVWIMPTRYKGKVYEFVMNGQTGKVVGTVPISLARCAAFWGILTVVGTVIGTVVKMFM